MKIVRLSDEQQLRELYAFRYAIYVDELGWLSPVCDGEEVGQCVDAASLAEGLLTDRFDSIALNYAALDDDGHVVGSMRVVPDGSLGLPLEECWPLNGFRSGKHSVELCRFAVAKPQRGTRLSLLLMKAGYQGAKRTGASHLMVDAYMDDVQRTHTLYQKFGFEPIGEPYADSRYVLTTPSVVMSVEWERGEPQLPMHLRRYFTSPDPMIAHEG